MEGACAFCRSPLTRSGDATGLLDYVAAHVPGAHARRNLIGRGPVRRLQITIGDRTFTGRLRRGGLEVAPGLEPELWAADLVAELGRAAASDHELRRALSRSGWALTFS